MQEKSQSKSKEIILKFNQIAVNQKYLRKGADGKSLWDKAKEKHIASFENRPEFGRSYRSLPNEDHIIQNALVNEHREPYMFERLLKTDGTTYSLDEINTMSEKDRAGLPLYKMKEEDAAFYLSDAQVKVLPRDDRTRAYKDHKDFERDMIKVPLAEIVG
jgi:hypothetical protein